MTRVRIQRADDEDHEPIAELELDFIPRVGETLDIHDDSIDIDLPWHIVYVSHEIQTIHSRFVEHVVVITVSHRQPTAQQVYLEWQDESERPDWIADDMAMDCDAIPRQGDVIQIGVNDEHYATEGAPVVAVEVIAIVHITLMVPGDNPMFLADQTTVAAVVRNVDQTLTGEMQRIVASRRN